MDDDPRGKFLSLLQSCVHDGSLVKLVLGKPLGGAPDLRNLYVRPVELRGAPHLSFVWRHETKDITKNHALAEGLRHAAELIGPSFHSAHLFTVRQVAQLEYNKKGTPRLTFGKPEAPASNAGRHDRAKSRLLPSASEPWLKQLGILTASGTVSEGMADKHRQIHKFVEILSHLAAPPSSLAELRSGRPWEIADMGSGKGYLTFATHDYFNLVAARPANVCGIEARPGLVEMCNRIAVETDRPRLRFAAGAIGEADLLALDVLIALHACDTATDDALARGIAAGAALLVVAPCCQKELRPQLQAPPVLGPALRHGIFQERHAEFVTDALRALLLEWAGYDTKVFEFISTEHTAKNTMIAATKRPGHPGDKPARAAAVRELAAFYGITTQALARHLDFSLRA